MSDRRLAVLLASVLSLAACSGGATTLEVTATTAAPSTTPVTAATTSTTTSTTTTTAAPTTTSTSTTTTTTEPPPFRWNLMAGGDVLMDRTEPANVDPFAPITPNLGLATISLINVEMAISDRGSPVPGKTFTFRAPSSAADTIAEAGIDVVTLANNHARDYGPTAMLDTIELLTERGVTVVGAGENDTEAFTPRVVRVDERIDVAFIGATLVLPGGFAASANRAGVANGNERDRVIANVRVAKEKYDIVVVTLHWGTERATCPSKTHVDFAAQLLDAGATAVIGHHPHVLQPIEFEDGKVTVFSLGNFIWHPRTTITADTGVVELVFEEEDLIDVVFHPHSLDENGAPAPISEGFRYERIVDIVSGDCAKHQPPPTAAPTTAPATTAPPESTTTTTASPDSTTTTAATSTTVAATTTTAAATTTTSG